jgi:type IV pilus assembly protein PilM
MSLFTEEENFFGLDLGASSIKLAQLKQMHGKPSLLTYGDMELPPNLLASDSPVDQDKLAQMIGQLVEDARVSTKNVVAALPSNFSYAAVITMPKLSHEELVNAVRFQADKYIPMAIDQVKLDWVVIGPKAGSEDEIEVLLVAAPISLANKYLNIMQKAGLELIALEINPIAQTRSLLTPGHEPLMVIDFGSVATDMAIVTSQAPRLIRSANAGSRTMVRVLAQNLGLDEPQAQQFMHKFGLIQTNLEGQVYAALKPAIDTVVEEITKSITYFHESNPDLKVGKIVITGGTAALPGLPAYLANATGIMVEIGNPWNNISYPSSLEDKLTPLSLSYSSALGLAMRGMA